MGSLGCGTDLEILVREFFDAAINAHAPDACSRFCDAKYVWHGSDGDLVGLAAFRDLLVSFFQSFTEVRAELLDVIGARDRVAVRYRETATHSGNYLGIAATGVRASWEGVAIYRVENGLLAEEWSYADSASLLRQLGVQDRPKATVSRNLG
jgi:predicted ester cyclase